MFDSVFDRMFHGAVDRVLYRMLLCQLAERPAAAAAGSDGIALLWLVVGVCAAAAVFCAVGFVLGSCWRAKRHAGRAAAVDGKALPPGHDAVLSLAPIAEPTAMPPCLPAGAAHDGSGGKHTTASDGGPDLQ